MFSWHLVIWADHLLDWTPARGREPVSSSFPFCFANAQSVSNIATYCNDQVPSAKEVFLRDLPVEADGNAGGSGWTPSPEEVRDLALMATGVKLVILESLEGWGQSCCRVTKLHDVVHQKWTGEQISIVWRSTLWISLARLCSAAVSSTKNRAPWSNNLPGFAPPGFSMHNHQLCILVTAQQCSTVPQWYFIAMTNSSVMLVFEQPLSLAPCLQGGCVRWVRVDLSADKFFFVYGQ